MTSIGNNAWEQMLKLRVPSSRDKAKKKDKDLVKTILEAIQVDHPSIKKILKL